MERERERLRCQFEKRQNLLMAGSVLLILAGLFMFVCLFVSMTDEEMGPVSWISCGIAGIWEVAMGIWGILIARERRVDFSRAKIIVYESKLGVGLAWALYGIGLLAAAAVFGFAMADNGAALILAAVLALLLFGWAACWSDYRNRRILADDQRIWRYRFWKELGFLKERDQGSEAEAFLWGFCGDWKKWGEAVPV